MCSLLRPLRQVVNTNLLFANPFPEGRAIAIYNQSAQLVRADDLSVVPPTEARARFWQLAFQRASYWIGCSLLSCPLSLLTVLLYILLEARMFGSLVIMGTSGS